MGMSKHRYGDFLHHPLKQGFDYYYGIPNTNYKDFDDLEDRLFDFLLPRMRYYSAGILIATIIFLSCCRRVGSIGPKRFLFFTLLACIVFVLPPFMLLNLKFCNSILMRDYEVVEMPIRLHGVTTRLVQEGVEFMEKQVSDERPFLLFMSWLQVHTALHAVEPFAGNSKHGTFPYSSSS